MAQGVTGHKDFVCTPNSCTVRINYSETYDVATNKSTFTITSIQVRDTADYSSSYSRLNGKVLVNGTAVFSFNSDYGRVLMSPQGTFCTVVDDPEHGSYNPVTGSATIAHSATDGTATATIALVGNGYNYFKCMTSAYYNWFDYASSATQSVTLTTISRASTMAAPNGTLGQSQTLEISSSSAAFKHTIAWSCGSQSGSISAAAGVSSVAFTPPMALASENTTGTKVRINYTLTTLSGSTTIGTSTAQADYTIPSSIKPSVSSGWATVSPYNTGASSGLSIYLQGYSQARVSFDSSKVNISGLYGATIASYKIVFNGSEDTASPYLTPVLKTAGSQTVTAYVYDTRGRYASANLTFTVTAYSSPSLSGVEIYRSTSGGSAADDGTYIRVKATVNGGVSPLTMSVKYKLTTAGSYGAAESLTSGTAKVIGGGAILAANSYNVQITATDGVGNSTSYTGTVPGAFVTYNFREGGNGLGLGTYSEGANLLNTTWDIKTTRYIGYRAISREDIPSNAGLNDYWRSGQYRATSNSVAATIGNCPVKIAFKLDVYSGTGSDKLVDTPSTYMYITQRLEDHYGRIYVRTGETGSGTTFVWDAWQMVVMRTESYTLPASTSVEIPLTANKIYLISGGIGGSASSYVVWMGTSTANCKSAKILDFGGFNIAFTATGVTVSNLRTYAMSIGVLMIS